MLGAVRISAESLEDLVVRIAKQYGVPSALVKAVIKQESNWDMNASRYEQHLGDTSWGLMQVLLKTAKDTLNNDQLTIQELIVPTTNITVGTRYLGVLLNRWGNLKDAVAAYNAGSPRLDKDGKYVNKEYVDNVYRYFLMYDTLGPAATLMVTKTNPYIGLTLIGAAAVVGVLYLSRN